MMLGGGGGGGAGDTMASAHAVSIAAKSRAGRVFMGPHVRDMRIINNRGAPSLGGSSYEALNNPAEGSDFTPHDRHHAPSPYRSASEFLEDDSRSDSRHASRLHIG